MEKYTEQWREFRRWNRLGILAFVAVLPACGILVLISRLLPIPMILPLVVLVGCTLVVFVAHHQLRKFPCPRCRDTFMVRSFGLAGTGRKCVHCGLKLYADA